MISEDGQLDNGSEIEPSPPPKEEKYPIPEGYKRELKAFNMILLNVLSLGMLVVSLLIFILLNKFVFKRGYAPLIPISNFGLAMLTDILILIAIYIVLLILHELIHGFGFIVFCKAKRSDISFGVKLSKGYAYCSNKKPMTRNGYRLAIILPMIITGLIPAIICAIFFDVKWVILFAAAFSGGSGDIAMFISTLQYSKDKMFLDHPSAPAYYVYHKIDELPKNFVEATPDIEKALIDGVRPVQQEVTAKKKFSKFGVMAIAGVAFAILAAIVLGIVKALS